jgi:hypothetical protein
MRKIEEVLWLHHECGRTNRVIAQAVRASPTTVGDYLRRARLAGLAWPLVEGMSDPTLADAILDRLIHHAHPLTLAGESLRNIQPRLTEEPTPA